MILIMKKEKKSNWVSKKIIKSFRISIFGYICGLFYKIKGYEVEVIK